MALRRVLMTTDTVGGIWTFVYDLLRYLRRQSIEVILATMGREPSLEQVSAVESLGGVRLRVGRYKLEWEEDPWSSVDAAEQWLLDLEREFEPDLIHLNSLSFGALPFRAPKLVYHHSDVMTWWAAVESGSPTPAWDEYRERVGAGLHAADHVVFITEAMRTAVKSEFGPIERATVIYNGRAIESMFPHECESFVLACGRMWDKAKNLSALQSVGPLIPWPIKVAGEGLEQAKPEGVEPLGFLSESRLRDIMSRSEIFVHPAKYEPFGLAPLEAAKLGCALVLGDIPTLREVWGDAAIYVDPNSPAAIASALNELIQNPDRRSQLRHAASDRAESYSLPRMGDAILDLYRELTTDKPHV